MCSKSNLTDLAAKGDVIYYSGECNDWGCIFRDRNFFGAITMILKIMVSRKKVREQEIIQRGRMIAATVEKVVKMKSILYGKKSGKKSPYQVYYSYKHNEMEFYQKSNLFWEEPHYKIGDEIAIWVDKDGYSMLKP